MGTYTVKKGDTLSGIGAKLGVNYNSITGYKSGNPNLIYPGEVLSYGGGSNKSAAPAVKAAAKPSAADIAAREAADWNKKVGGLYNDVGTFDKNAKQSIDIYNATLERLGISDARTRVTDLRQQLLNTENLVRNVEGDVSGRTQEFNISENQRRRLVSQEQQPLVEQAGILGRNLEMASADYKDIMNEGKAQSEMEYRDQSDRRSALMERLQLAIGQAKNAEDKRRWEKEYAALRAREQEEKRRWEADYALKVKADQRAAAAASRGGGGGRGGSSGGVNSAVQTSVAKLFNSKKGKDSFVSPETYRAGMQQWTGAGGSPDDFNALFGGYVNPYHQKTWGGYY
jgi:hypothetical protein